MTDIEYAFCVIFLIPAIIYYLTIYLPLRWANPPACITTGVSRRRKILKDNLVKRTALPVAFNKMIPPGNKKTSSFGKKVGFNNHEDENQGNGRKIVRPVKGSNMWAPESKMCDHIMPIKHMPFPNIPLDGDLLYEGMTFLFMAVAMGMQYLNLYRTVWWLPNSYNNQTMNFYLIDHHVVAFNLIILSRRFLFSILMRIIKTFLAPKLWVNAHAAARMFMLGAIFGALSWCTYFIHMKYPLVKLFYLCYPIIIYLILFGFQSRPFLDLSTEMTAMHCCSIDPINIREEIDLLREDFNFRVKMIMFCSVIGAYYSSFIPCCFAQTELFYDVKAAAQQTALVWGTLAGRAAAHLLAAYYCDILHRAALHLGDWTLTDAPTSSVSCAWNESRLWGAGARVTHHAAVWECAYRLTAAQPACTHHARYYKLFKNPSIIQCVLLCLQLALVIVQLMLLYSSALVWHHILSVTLLLFINYYTLFLLLRDYIVAWKVYKAEQLIQEKSANSGTPVN